MSTQAGAELVNLEDYRRTGRTGFAETTAGEVTQVVAPRPLSTRSISFAALYPDIAATSPLLARMHELVSEALAYAISAHEAVAKHKDMLLADEELARVAAIMPELFCLRSIGDGFGIIVSGLHCALVSDSEDSEPLNKVWAVRKALETLSDCPFLSISDAITCMEQLADAGLQTVPSALGALGDAIGD